MKWMASAAAVVAMSVVGGCASGPRAPATGNVAGSAAQTAVAEGSGTTPRAAAGATANAAPSATAKAELGATANAASGATAHAEQGASANAAPGATANAGPGGTANAGPGGTANVGPGGAAGAPLPAAAASGTTAHAGPASTPAPADATAKPINRALIAQGYQPSTYRGQLYYCRKEKLTGSQFTHRVCLTEQEAALQERIAQDEMNKRNSVGKCLPPLCPNH